MNKAKVGLAKCCRNLKENTKAMFDNVLNVNGTGKNYSAG